MPKNERKSGRSSLPRPFYPLDEVKKLIKENHVFLSQRALDKAAEEFGWGEADILDALMKLEPKHFYKSDVSKYDRRVVFDFYKALKLKGENVYMHFYINDAEKKLILDSFKEI